MTQNSCATCAQAYGNVSDCLAEKALLPGRYLYCCSRSICSRCLNQNKRYETYCPYCQVTSTPSALPQGLKDPPAYSSLVDLAIPPPDIYDDALDPPPYTSNGNLSTSEKQVDDTVEDVLHFLTPQDTINGLSLAYRVPAQVLRKTNNVYSDHLLHGRKTILIPGEFYSGGISLSPTPIENEEEEIRKHKIRRWMVNCKVSEYDVAVLYLEQADWNLDAAIEAYADDEKWEKEHPNHDISIKKGKSAKKQGMRRFVGATR